MLSAARLAAVLKRTTLFKGLSPRDLDLLARVAGQRKYERGRFICHAGDPARELFVVLEGRVSVSRSGWSGSRRSVEFMVPGDVFGLPALAALVYPNEIQARTATVVAAVPKRDVSALMLLTPSLAQAVFSHMAERLHFVETMLLLSGAPVERKLSAALVYLHAKFGADVPLSRAELAEMAGVAPETAMRELRRFETKGWVRRRAGGVKVRDAVALRRAAVDL
jgi:CRP-like cAMP-binding protein